MVWYILTPIRQAYILSVCGCAIYSYRRGLTGVAYPRVGQCESLRSGISKKQIPTLFFYYVLQPYYSIPCYLGNLWHKVALQAMHIGQLIRQKLEEQGKTTSWLARELAYCRTNVYKIYNKKSIDTDLLLRISRLLQYDFFALYSHEIEKSVSD